MATEAVCSPAVAVIVASPLASAVTRPSASTVSTFSLEEAHSTLSVELSDCTVAVSWAVPPTLSGFSGAPEMVTDVAGVVTAISTKADLSPAVAVTVALPLAMAVTLPDASTVSTLSSEVAHITLSVEFAGSTAAVSCAVAPTASCSGAPEMVTDMAGTGSFFVSMVLVSKNSHASPFFKRRRDSWSPQS